MAQSNRQVRQWADWHVDLLRDVAGRADALTSLLVDRLPDDLGDDGDLALVALADRVHRDVTRLLVELDAAWPAVECRSRSVWGTAA